MKNALVIGGSGFLGKHLLAELVTSGIHVFAIENKTKIPQHNNVTVIKNGFASITFDLIEKINPDVVFHCARPTIPKLRRLGRKLAAISAASYNHSLIEKLKNTKNKPLLAFASGSLMYGNSAKPIDENTPLNPISYAKQYHKGEKPLLIALSKNDYPVMILRFPWLLGNGSWFKWFYLNPISTHNAIPILGKGLNHMEILDVNDAARLMIRYAYEKNSPGIYNLYSGLSGTQHQFAKSVSEIYHVVVKKHTDLFTGNIEKETIEAFTSNIKLTTLYPEILNTFKFTAVNQTLKEIYKVSAGN